MKAAKRKNEEARPAERNRVPRALDSGETRAIMLAAAFLFVFLYFIRLILLPFVLAAIVAYICTPLLDWPRSAPVAATAVRDRAVRRS